MKYYLPPEIQVISVWDVVTTSGTLPSVFSDDALGEDIFF